MSFNSPLCSRLKLPCNVPRGLKIVGGRGLSLHNMYLVGFSLCDTERREMDLRERRNMTARIGVSVSHEGDEDL